VRLALLRPTRSEPEAHPFHRVIDAAAGLKPGNGVLHLAGALHLAKAEQHARQCVRIKG
jgi:hypothetical protein